MRSWVGWKAVLLVLLLAACATEKVWRSSPAVQSASNDYFEVQLEPLKYNNPFYDSFRLTVANRADQSLTIDWIRTIYMHNGKNNGRFAFKGLDAESIKNPPPDIIPAGGRLSKMIWPIKLIGWVPFRDTGPDADLGFTLGLIPEGQNGIDLAVRLNGEEVRERITVTIVAE